MNAFKILSLSLFLTGATINVNAETKNINSVFGEYPQKTIVIKHPAAENVNGFFSKISMISFEVFKIGDKAAFIKALQSNADVESVSEGGLTGDFQLITITTKTTKDKVWFVELMKKAGAHDIKVNNKEVTPLDSF